jgi:hypothetical protein
MDFLFITEGDACFEQEDPAGLSAKKLECLRRSSQMIEQSVAMDEVERGAPQFGGKIQIQMLHTMSGIAGDQVCQIFPASLGHGDAAPPVHIVMRVVSNSGANFQNGKARDGNSQACEMFKPTRVMS